MIKTHDALDQPLNFDIIDKNLRNDNCDYVDLASCLNLNPNDFNLVVLQLNIRSLLSKQTELRQLIQDLENKNSKVDLILLCETFLNEANTKLVNILNYTLFTNNRHDHKGGGTGILVRKGITVKSRKDLEENVPKVIESTFAKITAKDGKRIVIGSLYRPPNSSLLEFINKLNLSISKIKNENKEAILGMDHNLDLLKAKIHKHMQLFIDDLLDKNILPMIL